MKSQEAIGEFILNLVKQGYKPSEAADAVFGSEFRYLPENPKDFQHDFSNQYKEELKNNPAKQAQELYQAIERGEKIDEDPYGD